MKTEDGKIVCPYCKKEFKKKQNLGGHIIHCKLNPKYEELKLKVERNFDNYNNSNKCKGLNEEKECYCQYCGKKWHSLNSLKNHEKRCKENPNKMDLSYLSNRDYNNFNFNPSNQFIKAKEEGREIIISQETRYKIGSGWRNKKLLQEHKDKISNSMHLAVLNHPESYLNIKKYSRVKKAYYKDILFDSNWEIIVAKYLDENNIEWKRPNNGFEYYWNEKVHLYFPDFYLPEYNMYIEVKGQETERDIAKWKALSNLIIIKINEIKRINRNTYNIFEYLK